MQKSGITRSEGHGRLKAHTDIFLEKIYEEMDQRYEQTVDLFEAEAADKLNQLLMRFQIIVTGIVTAGVTAELTREYGLTTALPWTLGIGILAMFLSWIWLRYRLKRSQR